MIKVEFLLELFYFFFFFPGYLSNFVDFLYLICWPKDLVWSKIIIGATWNFSIIYNLMLIYWFFFIIDTFIGQEQMLLAYIYSLCKSHFWWILLQSRNALKHVLNPKTTWFCVFDFCFLFNLSVFIFSFKKQKENNICFRGWHILCIKIHRQTH